MCSALLHKEQVFFDLSVMLKSIFPNSILYLHAKNNLGTDINAIDYKIQHYNSNYKKQCNTSTVYIFGTNNKKLPQQFKQF